MITIIRSMKKRSLPKEPRSLWKRKMRSLTLRLGRGKAKRDYTGALRKRG